MKEQKIFQIIFYYSMRSKKYINVISEQLVLRTILHKDGWIFYEIAFWHTEVNQLTNVEIVELF